jgi:hypothetical protein
VKTEKSKISRRMKIWRVKKCSIYQKLLVLLFVALFCFSRVSASVVINEVLVGEKGTTNNEFVELYNDSGSAVALDGYKLKIKKTTIGAENYLVNNSFFKGTIKAHGYFTIAYPDYVEKIKADLPYSTKSNPIANNNTILLYDNFGALIDEVGFGTAPLSEKKPAQNPSESQSIGRLEGKDSDDNSHDFTLQNPTPGKANEIYVEPITEKRIYPKGLFINELFAKPLKGSEDVEFVELFNPTSELIKLDGWQIIDRGSNRCDLAGKEIEKKSFLIIENDTLKKCIVTLNDTGQEVVNLLDPNGETVNSVSYASAKENLSYSFDGAAWHWTKFVTKGKENIFEAVPAGTLDVDENIYVDVYANFAVGGLSDSAKVTWDFGDGHKSYLVKTQHKYESLGKFEASVKFSDGSEEVVKNFTVEVVEVSHPKVRIIAVNANPKGIDTGKESLTIENKSNKKINLSGWSIATGWKKKFVNHSIRKYVIIKKNKTQEITNEVSSFTLNNTKAKIQLRYPDGKVAHEVKYKSPNKSIADDEIYQKVKVEWEWVASKETITKKQATNNTQDIVINIQTNTNAEIAVENKTEEIIAPVDIKKENKLLALNNSQVKIELLKSQPRVLGAETVREIDGVYLLTPEVPQKDHYVIVFLRNFSVIFNSFLNALIDRTFLK